MEGLSFEQALERVESIIERIESGEVGLEEAIGEYETGARLIRRCREILGRAEQRIERLSLELDGGEGGGSSPPPRADEEPDVPEELPPF